jgi:natural product precursor
MHTKKLSLKKEVLAELSADELTSVVGGTNTETCLTAGGNVTHCVSFQECPATNYLTCLVPTNQPACTL